MYENLINQTIDKTNIAFNDFPDSLDGEVYLGGDASVGWQTKPNFTQAELDAIALTEAKQAIQEALSNIVVTTSNGNTFDGDDVARADMLNAIIASETLGLTEHTWKLSDNSWKEITLDELKEASALAIQRKGEILAS